MHPQALIIKACQAVDSKPAIVTTARSNSHIPLMQTGIHCWLLVSVLHRLLLAYRATIFTYWHHVKYMISYNPIQVRFITFAQRHTLRYVNHTDHLVRIPKNWTHVADVSPLTVHIADLLVFKRPWQWWKLMPTGSKGMVPWVMTRWWQYLPMYSPYLSDLVTWSRASPTALNLWWVKFSESGFFEKPSESACEMMTVEDFCRATCRAVEDYKLPMKTSCNFREIRWSMDPYAPNACWNSLLSGLCITRQPSYSHPYHDHTRVFSVYSHDSWMFSFLRMHVEVQWSSSIVLSVLHPPK